MPNGKIQLEHRLTTAEEEIKGVKTLIIEIRDNHIPHLDAKLNKVLFWVFTTLFGFALSIIGGLILFVLKR